MTCPYHSDLASSQQAIQLARDDLLVVIDLLSRADHDCARKGGWPVRRVLEHVIHSERLYGQATAYLVGAEAASQAESRSPESPADARRMLLDARKALLSALQDLEMDPRASEKFYELRQVGHEEYSILSVLENVANHDREHAGQIRVSSPLTANG
jgi:uncharacterized damage-inducible protein DinB